MHETGAYQNLRFDKQPRRLPHRLIAVCLIMFFFTIFWRYVPHNALYWILLPILAILGWLATYSWRQALSSLILFLHRLEQH